VITDTLEEVDVTEFNLGNGGVDGLTGATDATGATGGTGDVCAVTFITRPMMAAVHILFMVFIVLFF